MQDKPHSLPEAAVRPAEPWQFSARQLSEAFGSGLFDPVEALESTLGRIAALNPALNAIIAFDPSVKAAAEESARRWRAGEPLSLLDGVPLTIKDNIVMKGLPTTWGSRLFAEFVSAEDETPVARLREAGALLIGKTNVPEFTLQGYTDNLLFGPTGNPWGSDFTPGGSSGGAAAAVAAGFGPIAIGTDGGGSIRRPAGHTGLFGLKSSSALVPRTHGLPQILHDFETVGALARTVADLALAMTVISGGRLQHHEDPIEPLRILFVPRFGAHPVDPEITAGVAAAVRNFEGLGHHIEEGPLPFDINALDQIWRVIGPSGLAFVLRGHKDWQDQITPAMCEVARLGSGLSAADYVQALGLTDHIREALSSALSRFDAILTPSTAALPWPKASAFPPEIDGSQVGPRGHAVFTNFANVGGLPGIAIPCGRSRTRLPFGCQLVGARGADDLLLRVAAQYEAAHPIPFVWSSPK